MRKLKRLKRLSERRRQATERRRLHVKQAANSSPPTTKKRIATVANAVFALSRLAKMSEKQFVSLALEGPPSQTQQFAREILSQSLRKPWDAIEAAMLAQQDRQRPLRVRWGALQTKIQSLLQVEKSRYSFEAMNRKPTDSGKDLPPLVTYVKPRKPRHSEKRDVASRVPKDYMRPMSKEYDMPEYDLE